MPQADRDYLAAYVRAQPSRAKDESLADYLRRVGVDDSAPSEAQPAAQPNEQPQMQPQMQPQEQARLRNTAQRAQAKAAADAKLDAEAEQRKQAAKNADLIHKGFYASGIVPNAAADRVERVRAWLANLPTPGGNGALLLVLLGFVAFIVPVNGSYTRAQLWWLSLLGRTSLTDQAGGEPTAGRSTTGEPARTATIADSGGSSGAATVTPATLPFTLPLPSAGGVQLPVRLS